MKSATPEADGSILMPLFTWETERAIDMSDEELEKLYTGAGLVLVRKLRDLSKEEAVKGRFNKAHWAQTCSRRGSTAAVPTTVETEKQLTEEEQHTAELHRANLAAAIGDHRT